MEQVVSSFKKKIIIYILICFLSELILKSNSAPTPTGSAADNDHQKIEDQNLTSISFYSSLEVFGSGEDDTVTLTEDTVKKKKSRREEVHEDTVNNTNIHIEQDNDEEKKYSIDLNEQLFRPGAELFSRLEELLKNTSIRSSDLTLPGEIPIELEHSSSVSPEDLLRILDEPYLASGKSSRQLGGLGLLATEAFGDLPHITRTLLYSVPSNIIQFTASVISIFITDLAFISEQITRDGLLLFKDWIDYVRYVRTYLREQFLGTIDKPGALRQFLQTKLLMAGDMFYLYIQAFRLQMTVHYLLWDGFKSKVSKQIDKIKKMWRAEWRDTLRNWIRDLRERMRPVWDFIRKRIMSKTEAAKDKIGRLYETLKDCLNFIYRLCNEVLDVVDQMKILIQDIIRAVEKRIQRKLEKVESFIRDVIKFSDQSKSSKLQQIWKTIRDFINKIACTIRSAYRTVMKKLRPKWFKIVRKYRSFKKYMRNLFRRTRKFIITSFRDKYRKIFSRINAFVRGALRTGHTYLHRLFRFLDKMTRSIRCKVNDVFQWIKSFLTLLMRRTSFFSKHIFNRIRYFSLVTFKFVKGWLRYLKNRDWAQMKKLIEPFTNYLRKILKEIVKEVKYQWDFYANMIEDLTNHIIEVFKYIFGVINARVDQLYDFVKEFIKTIGRAIDYVHDFFTTIAKALFYVIKFIIIKIRIKKLDKWRYIAQGIYYFLYISHRIIDFIKYIFDVPNEIYQWLIPWLAVQLENFREWVRENVFERPGLFYFIGDIIRTVKDKSTIFGWFRDKAMQNRIVKFLVNIYGESPLMHDLSRWIEDRFIKQWVQWHVFRSTTTSTTSTSVPDLRPYFVHETILESVRLLGDPNNDEKLPRSPFDEKIARSIGAYLYYILNGKRDKCCGYFDT